MKRKLSPLPYEAGECSSSGSRRPGHPHSTPRNCERAKTKLTTPFMQDSILCPRQYLHAPLLCRGALCRVSHQPGKYRIKTKIKAKSAVPLTRKEQNINAVSDHHKTFWNINIYAHSARHSGPRSSSLKQSILN